MTPVLTAISGLSAKAAACFLLETGGRRLLLDLGRVPGPQGLPDLAGVGPVDAVVLTHMHPDHAAGLAGLDLPGGPAVYATALTAEAIGLDDYRPLPLRGTAEVAGVRLTLGRNGHAPGGVWVHVAAGEGLLYCGDLGFRSKVLPLDPLPAAATVVLDASFGAGDPVGADHEAALQAAIRATPGPLVLPAPAWGRGVELALAAAASGAEVVADAALMQVIGRLAQMPEALHPGAAEALDRLARAAGASRPPAAGQAIVLGDPMLLAPGSRALVARLRAAGGRVALSGHCHPGTPAAAMLATGEASSLPWPTHPSWAENRSVLRQTGARQVVAAFCDPSHWPALAAEIGPAALARTGRIALS